MANVDALIEIAIQIMNESNGKKTLHSIAKEVFAAKGIKFNDKSEEYAQFQIDFMLCGDFIVCGEVADENGNISKLWDLKNRQPLEIQDRETYVIENSYEDEEAIKNELNGESGYQQEETDSDSDFEPKYRRTDDDEDEDDDSDEDNEEKDEIEEELEMNGNVTETYDPEDDVEEDCYDDKDED